VVVHVSKDGLVHWHMMGQKWWQGVCACSKSSGVGAGEGWQCVDENMHCEGGAGGGGGGGKG